AGAAPTALRTALPFAVPESLWRRVCRDRDVCLGARGPFWEACLYRRDLLRSREAHLLVVNHALFFLDVKTGGRILPPHAAVVLDEAHRAEEAALSQLDVAVSDRSVARLLDDLGPSPRRSRRAPARQGAGSRDPGGPGRPGAGRLGDARARVAEEAEGCFEEARRQAEALGGARPGAPRRSERADGGALLARVRAAGLVDDRLGGPLRELEEALDEAAASAGPPESQSLAALAARARDLRDRLAIFLTQSLPDAVYWVESARRRAADVGLHAAPIEVAAFLRPRLLKS